MMPKSDAVPLRRMRPLLGTFVEIGLVERPAGTHCAERTFAAAYAAIAKVHDALSFHDPHSELTRLNASKGQPIRMSVHALRVLRLARAMTAATGGLFNCTVGGAMIARGRLPDHGGDSVLPVGDADDIEISATHACLRRPVRITVDGIAKGYAVDVAVSTLRAQGVESGWINAGGDVRAFGELVLPVLCVGQNGNAVRVELYDCSVASSEAGARADAGHDGEIIDMHSQQPVSGRWSVLSHHAWRADALTKVAALAGPAMRERLLSNLGGRCVVAEDVDSVRASAA